MIKVFTEEYFVPLLDTLYQQQHITRILHLQNPSLDPEPVNKVTGEGYTDLRESRFLQLSHILDHSES